MFTTKLDDNRIYEIKQAIQQKQLGLKQIDFRYVKGDLYIEAVGIEGIPQKEDCYDNIEDHIVFTDLNWLTPLCNELKVNLDASITVNPDGTLNHSDIEIGLHTVVYGDKSNKLQILSSLLPLLKKLIPFRSYLTNIEFIWHDYKLRNIRFGMNLDGKKVNTILKNSQVVNSQILSQWSSTISTVIDYNMGRYKHNVNVPIVNGRMNTATYRTGLCFKFEIGRAHV